MLNFFITLQENMIHLFGVSGIDKKADPSGVPPLTRICSDLLRYRPFAVEVYSSMTAALHTQPKGHLQNLGSYQLDPYDDPMLIFVFAQDTQVR